MKKIQILSLFLVLILAPLLVNAGECYSDPIYERNWHGKYNISAYVRDNPCVQGTNIIDTVTQGKVVEIIAETDGWYKVKTPSGKIGWTGAKLMSITSEALTTEDTKNPASLLATQDKQETIDTYSDASFLGRVRGKLLLQVENWGEIWYVNPTNDQKYEIRQDKALDLFRNHALGISDADIAKIPTVDEKNHELNMDIRNHVRGRILLQVEESGKTWYVIPGTLNRVQITTATLLDTFRKYSLGVSNADLSKITDGNIDQSSVGNSDSAKLSEVGITAPANWQKYTKDGYSFYHPSGWYSGKKDYQPNWTYISEEKDYIDNLNTRNYMGVDSYVLTYKLTNRVSTNDSDSTALKKGGYYLSGYKITESTQMKINGIAALKEILYAPSGTTVYGNRITHENETIILYTFRKGTDLYRIQYFNAHWVKDYGFDQFDNIARSFKLN